MKNFLILFILCIPMTCIHAWGSLDPEDFEDECIAESNFFFGITSILVVPSWLSTCYAEAGDPFFNPNGNQVDIDALVNNSYGSSGSNNWNWWIEAGWQDDSICFDDEVGQLDGFGCIQGRTRFAACPLPVWIQVVGECDTCIENRPGGTWYKSEFMMDPSKIGVTCGGSINMTKLILQPRTECTDTTFPWGCGPNESQD